MIISFGNIGWPGIFWRIANIVFICRFARLSHRLGLLHGLFIVSQRCPKGLIDYCHEPIRGTEIDFRNAVAIFVELIRIGVFGFKGLPCGSPLASSEKRREVLPKKPGRQIIVSCCQCRFSVCFPFGRILLNNNTFIIRVLAVHANSGTEYH